MLAAPSTQEDTFVLVELGSLFISRICTGHNGQLLCWGENANGEAVPGGSARVTTPTLVQTGVARAEAGREGTCTVDLANVVRCWGVNDCHQRGPSDDNPTLAAELIPGYP